jgi:pyruvate dehydrogenase E1 component alpha subunit
MNMASCHSLPMIFMYENNGYAEFSGAKWHMGKADITRRAAGFGMPAVKVDGTDFFAVYDAMGAAVERARNGEGPSSIEAVAMRWYGHFEGDMQLYRKAGEVDELRKNSDPLIKFEARVTAEFDISAEELREIDEELTEIIDEAVDLAKAAPKPTNDALFTDVYASY